MAHPFSTVILAGGRSRRMGRPKAALPLGSTSFLARLVTELHAASDDLVVVSAPHPEEPYPVEQLLEPFDGRVKLIRDPLPFAGPVPALIAGLRAARHPIVFGCSCDLPLLDHSVARVMTEMLDDFDAVLPVVDGRPQPLCAIYRRTCADRLEEFHDAGEHRLTAVVKRLRTRRIDESELRKLDPDLRSFFNVNTPEEYALAVKMEALDRASRRA